jgi:hypothetical protein
LLNIPTVERWTQNDQDEADYFSQKDRKGHDEP